MFETLLNDINQEKLILLQKWLKKQYYDLTVNFSEHTTTFIEDKVMTTNKAA